eukprot:SAG31_NODE_38603_length_295_cov_0.683673_1_plen_36_part_01
MTTPLRAAEAVRDCCTARAADGAGDAPLLVVCLQEV